MKKLFAILIALFVLTLTAFAGVNEKLLYTFNKAFPSVQNVKWSEDSNGYFVSFIQFGISSKVAYDTHGNFLYSSRYYKEENLPVSILLAVKQKFADKNIFSVTEVSTPNNITYHIKLEDAKSWYDVRVATSGNVSVDAHFKKSDF